MLGRWKVQSSADLTRVTYSLWPWCLHLTDEKMESVILSLFRPPDSVVLGTLFPSVVSPSSWVTIS